MPSLIVLPEQHAYGSIGFPSPNRNATLAADHDDGPDGTVRVEVRDRRPKRRPQANDLSRYWIDPLEKGITRKWQSFSLFTGTEDLLQHGEIIQTARTPNGYAYPTQLRLGEHGVTYFWLDFNVKLKESVFDSKRASMEPSP